MLIELDKKLNQLQLVAEHIQHIGYCVIDDVIAPDLIRETKERIYSVQEKIHADIGKERLAKAGEIGVLRLMMKYDPFFLQFLAIPELLNVIDNSLSNTAILHLQNGFINPPVTNVDGVFQYGFHRDFPRVLNGYLTSINIFIAVTDFTKDNGATLVVPGSQQKMAAPTEKYMRDNAISVECKAGSLIIFDSTLWHAAGKNITDGNRIGINHQFTRSYIKQQIDYVRALDNQLIATQSPRTQQLLGYYTRVVTSLDEYYVPEQERLYRKGQG